MNYFTIQLYRILVPKYFRRKILRKRLPLSIFKYYQKFPEIAGTEEIAPILDYLKTNPVTMLPYPFQDRYLADEIEVFEDSGVGLRYVLLDGKKLYFKKRWGHKKIQKVYNDLLKEQDIQSPHRYLSEQFQFNEGDVLVDAGAAEGYFALSMVEKASQIILFEPDREWIEPLQATFEPWKDKVKIIHKFIGDVTLAKQIALDDVISPSDLGLFVKVDVEGAELRMLKGAGKLLAEQKSIKLSVCTYHKAEDEKELTELLLSYHFDVAPSKGYMLPIFDKRIKAPYFRRGLIRAKK